MAEAPIFAELSERLSRALRESPAGDVERNLRAILAGWVDRLELASREDLEVQKKVLERAYAKIAELEARVAELEAQHFRK